MKKIKINVSEKNLNSPSHVEIDSFVKAARDGNVEEVKATLKKFHKLIIDKRDSKGHTALDASAGKLNANLAVVAALLGAGADFSVNSNPLLDCCGSVFCNSLVTCHPASPLLVTRAIDSLGPCCCFQIQDIFPPTRLCLLCPLIAPTLFPLLCPLQHCCTCCVSGLNVYFDLVILQCFRIGSSCLAGSVCWPCCVLGEWLVAERERRRELEITM